MVELNFTFVLFLASFLAFIFLMNLFFFAPVKKVIGAREDLIQKNIEETNAIAQKLDEQVMDSSAESILKTARENAQKILGTASQEAEKTKSSLIEENSTKLKTMYKEHMKGLDQEKQAISSEISKICNEVADIALEKISSEIGARTEVAA